MSFFELPSHFDTRDIVQDMAQEWKKREKRHARFCTLYKRLKLLKMYGRYADIVKLKRRHRYVDNGKNER